MPSSVTFISTFMFFSIHCSTFLGEVCGVFMQEYRIISQCSDNYIVISSSSNAATNISTSTKCTIFSICMLLVRTRAIYTDRRLLSFDVSFSFERSIWSLYGSVEFLVFWSSWWEESNTTTVLIVVCAARNSSPYYSQNKNIGAYSILSVDDKEEMGKMLNTYALCISFKWPSSRYCEL